MDKFKIENLYQRYLQLVALQEETMHPQQRVQLRQTFFGACGQLLILLRDDLTPMSEEHGAAVLAGMLDEVNAYFTTRLPQN